MATCGGAGGQWRMVVRPPASAHGPHGTGLNPSRASSAFGVQWQRRGPRTAGFPGTSACARGLGTAGLSWHAPARRRARELGFAKSV
jgi:hypothetical protein